MKEEIDSGELTALRANAETLMTVRRAISTSLGVTFDGKRDLYKACGYPKDITHQEVVNRYTRGDIAKTVVEAMPDLCWQVDPEVWDEDDASKETEFEKEWKRLVDEVEILSEMRQLDVLAGLGQYAVLYLGFDDTADLSLPPRKGSKLLYTIAYREGNAAISQTEGDTKNMRFGRPLLYQLTADGGIAGSKTISNVHYSRIIHFVDNRIDSINYGSSRLHPVWNRLLDIDTIMGGGAEGQWRAGFPGIFFGMDKDARMTPEGKADFDEQVRNYTMNLDRVIRGQGITPHSMSSQLISPLGQLQAELWMISATSRIPYRILTGAEQGELASSKDQDNWNTRGSSRRLRTCDPRILKPTIRRLIEIGSLPAPKNGRFQTEWPSGREEKESEIIGNKAAKVIMAGSYLNGGVEQLIPRESFMVDFMGMSVEEAQSYLEQADAAAQEQMEAAAADQKAAEEEAAQLASKELAGAGGTETGTTPVPPPQKPSAPPSPRSIKGLRALWDAARAALGRKDEPSGLSFGDRVEAVMPDGTVAKGKIIGEDLKGNALMFTDDKRVIALPEQIKE